MYVYIISLHGFKFHMVLSACNLQWWFLILSVILWYHSWYLYSSNSFILVLNIPLNKHITIYLFYCWCSFSFFSSCCSFRQCCYDHACKCLCILCKCLCNGILRPGSGSARFAASSTLLHRWPNCFGSNCPNLYSRQQGRRVPVVFHPCQNVALGCINFLPIWWIWNGISLWFSFAFPLITNGNKHIYVKAFVFCFYVNSLLWS